MKKILATALALVFILALTIPGFADGDTVVTMEVPEMAPIEDCEWTLTIPAETSIDFSDLYNKYKNYSGTGNIETLVSTGSYSLDIIGLPKDYQISFNTTHTPFSSPDTDTTLNYGINYNKTVFTTGNVEVVNGDEDIHYVAANTNIFEGKSKTLPGRIISLWFSDIEAIGALKTGSYTSTITFTSALEPIA